MTNAGVVWRCCEKMEECELEDKCIIDHPGLQCADSIVGFLKLLVWDLKHGQTAQPKP